MKRFTSGRAAAVALMAALAGTVACEQTKSASPLSPAIYGPIAGVTITAPAAMAPINNQKVKDNEQPLLLTFSNPESNSVRPFTLVVQMSADASFTGVVYTQRDIAPSADGVNRLRLPAKLPSGRVYFWRTKAEDGANESEWGHTAAFEVLQPIVIGVPNPVNPIGGGRVTSTSVDLLVQNGASSGPHGQLAYLFQASLNPAFNNLIVDGWSNEGSGQTRFTMNSPAADTVVYWRSAVTNGTETSAWSRVEAFRTPLAASGGGPTPPPGGGNGGSCASNHGPTVVKCIEGKFPGHLAAGVSHNQREANMAFLRDRIIEAGRCGGMDLGRNFKRGNGPHSIDAIAWRTGGTVEVVDIGLAYDDTSTPLRLSWGIVAGPAGFDPYPSFSCQ